MTKIVLDAGTTWAKIVEHKTSNHMKTYDNYLVHTNKDFKYYIIPSSELKKINFKFNFNYNYI